MTAAWNDEPKSWKVASENPWSLTVILQSRAFIFPWSQFLYVDGTDDEITIVFSTHDVVVTGSHLSELLADLSAHHVSLIRQPIRAEGFGATGVLRMTGILVRKVE